MAAALTRRENQILELIAHGLSADEIADALFISPETVRTTSRNIKLKMNLQKASELTASYWCDRFGMCFEECRKEVLSGIVSIAILFVSITSIQHEQYRVRRLLTLRRARTEYAISSESLI